MDITITYSSIQTYVGNHLAVIGKRAKDAQDKTMWSTIMASSYETVVLKDYINSACDKVVGELTSIVDNAYFTASGLAVTIFLENQRWNEDEKTELTIKHKGVNEIVENLVTRFVQNYTIAEFLNMFAPDYAKKYENEEISILSDLKILALKKKPAEQSDKSYTDIKVETDVEEETE